MSRLSSFITLRCLYPFVSCSVLFALAGGCSSDDPFVANRDQPIVGGTYASDSFLPAVGALAAYGSFGWGGSVQVMPFCTGTLISDRLVLSAAHCVEAIGTEIPAGLPIGFFTGANVRSGDAGSRILKIKSWQKHPNYKGGNPPAQLSDWHDIAVLQLESPTTTAPMKMLRPKEVPSLLKIGESLLIVGYGMTNPNYEYSSGAKYYGSTALQQVGSSEIWILAGGGAQKCNGDSGGPTFVETAKGNQDYRIIGVASRAGQGCSFGSVETRVDSYLDWIGTFGPIPCGSGLSADCNLPPKKKLGESCSQDVDCEGKLCIATDGDYVCSQPCALTGGSCPAGFHCASTAGRTDGACVKDAPQVTKKALGAACEADSECASGKCVQGESTRYCTETCTPDVGCGSDSMDCVADDSGQFTCAPKPDTAAVRPPGGGCTFAMTPPRTMAALSLVGLGIVGLLGLALYWRRRIRSR